MSPVLADILRYTVFVAGIIAVVKFNQISKVYYPFIVLIWLAGINEAVSSYLVSQGYYTIINNNIYCLLEAILLLWFFRNMNVFKVKALFIIFLVVFIMLWAIDVLIINTFGTAFSSYFNIVYYFVLVLLAITAINKLIIEEKYLFKSPSFLIYISVIIYFTYGILIEAFFLYGLGASTSFIAKVYFILYWINPICNIIYALAILWMRKRQAFTLQF